MLVFVSQILTGLGLAHADAPLKVEMTPDHLKGFFDARVPIELKRGHVAGAAVAVVRDGKILFVQGYGLADVARGTPVSGADTLFRIASLSKVFTYTAVMQLVERGKIDLDSDIARYLGFPVPEAFGQPITVRHLMTHTAGFDETVENLWRSSGPPVPLRDYLVHHMPKRLYPPGSTPSYSSYGTALAAHIVERVSGQTFDQYVEDHILKRLGMANTSFQQALQGRLAANASKNYMSGHEPARPFEITNVSPSAGGSSTAADMAKFMLAHLSTGEHATKLLEPATRVQMQTVSYRHHPSAPGLALGMYEMEEDSVRVLGHHGDTPLSHSAMYLLDDARTGLFVVQNSGVHPVRTSLLKQFKKVYFPGQSTPAPSTPAPPDQSGRIGSYLATRSFASSPLYMSDLLTKQTLVQQGPGGSLLIGRTYRDDGQIITWRTIGEGVWQSDDGSARKIYFRRDQHGDWVMGNGRNPTHVEKRSPWYLHFHLVMGTLILSLVVVVLHLIGLALAAVMRARASKTAFGTPPGKATHVASALTLAPWLLYGATAIVILNDNLLVATPGFGAALRCIQALAWIAAAAIGVHCWTTFRIWRAARSSWGLRAWHLTLVLAALGLSALAAQGNLLVWDGRW